MHLKSFLLLFAVVFFHCTIYSQNSKYDTVFSETAQVLLSSNPKKALSNTDYLYKISNNNAERIKACMLKATLLRQYGIRNEAISALKRADSLAIIDKNYTLQARINGFLSTLFRENEIYSLGKIHLQKALAVSKKIEDKNEMYKFQGNLSQEIAYYEMFDANYSKAIAHLKSGNQLFEKAGSSIDKNFQIAVNDELIAKNYLSLQKVDSAMITYQKAMKELDASQSSNSPLKGFIYNGFANVYYTTGDYKNAIVNYQKAEKIADESNFFALKQEVYNSLLEFYKKTDNKKYILYNEKNLALNKNEEHNRKIIADDLIKSLRKKQVENKSQYQKTTYIIIGICIFSILLILGYYYYRRQQDYKKFKKFINKTQEVPDIDIEAVSEPKKEIAKEYMSEATENSILKSIQEFEKSHFYLNKDLSLNSVAAELNINHRYLSYVINKHKSKDFAGYINELRINYIVDRLRNDSNYLKYKISYLADQSGFSSHSRFTINFKKITGVSPLDFITYLQKEN
ncbi:helix-turn-helix domain-containing protein [Flavobacterium sp. N1736]|uniref:helix-turn-helix domain-containing protein n=1 Tax=Flavobacterium sp. N1736 TaxID=2986823 RepID=UPI0022240B72|nr:helix-turn-helix domain-containing protein [Flavobacterium sp. N1736]